MIDGGRCVYQGGLEQLRGGGGARVLVRCPDPVRLAGALAAAGFVEIDTLSDGRLAVAGADAARIGDLALQAGVAVHGLVGAAGPGRSAGGAGEPLRRRTGWRPDRRHRR